MMHRSTSGGDADERVTAVELAHPANESDVRAVISQAFRERTFVAAILVGMSSIGYLAGFEALPLVVGSVFTFSSMPGTISGTIARS